MENEIMNNVEEVVEANQEAITKVSTGNGNIKAAAIGAGIVGAGVALFEIGKRVYRKIKTKKGDKYITTDFVEKPEDENENVEK